MKKISGYNGAKYSCRNTNLQEEESYISRGRTVILQEKNKKRHKIMGKNIFSWKKTQIFNMNFKYKFTFFSNDYCKLS